MLGFGNVILNGGTFQAGANGLNIANNFDLTPAGGAIDTNGFSLTLSGTISDIGIIPGTLTKNGAGTLILTSASSYSGGTILNAGTLRLENSFALGSGDLTINGAKVDYADTVGITNTFMLQGNAQLEVATGLAMQFGSVLEDASPRQIEKTGAGTSMVFSLDDDRPHDSQRRARCWPETPSRSAAPATTRWRPARRWTSAALPRG